jgi:hypothetical protein
VYGRAIGLVLVTVLAGCATYGGPPLGGRMMFEAMAYRPATPLEAPDTAPARKKAKQEREALERALTQGCLPREGEALPTRPSATLAPPPRIVLASSGGPSEGDY